MPRRYFVIKAVTDPVSAVGRRFTEVETKIDGDELSPAGLEALLNEQASGRLDMREVAGQLPYVKTRTPEGKARKP